MSISRNIYRLNLPGSPFAQEPEAEPTILISDATETSISAPWIVILYNDQIHTFDDVIDQLIKAIGCTVLDAERLAWQVHTEGKACVYDGDFEVCFRVQSVLGEIGLNSEIRG